MRESPYPLGNALREPGATRRTHLWQITPHGIHTHTHNNNTKYTKSQRHQKSRRRQSATGTSPLLPTPTHTVARVRPNMWLITLCGPTAPPRDWNERGKTTLSLLASFAEVPLEVMSRRKSEFRRFVSKVIFGRGEGIIVGVHGVAAIGKRVEGLPIGGGEDEGEGGDDDEVVEVKTGRGVDGGLVVAGLPFQGGVFGGKGSCEIGCGVRGPCVLFLAFLFVCE